MITSKAIIENKTSLWANKKCNSSVMSSCHQAIVQFLQSQSKAVVKMPPSFDKAIIKQLQAWNFHQAMFNIGKRSLSWCKLSRNCYKTVRNINISNCINKFWVGIILSQSDINQFSKVWASQCVTRLAYDWITLQQMIGNRTDKTAGSWNLSKIMSLSNRLSQIEESITILLQ